MGFDTRVRPTCANCFKVIEDTMHWVLYGDGCGISVWNYCSPECYDKDPHLNPKNWPENPGRPKNKGR